jgi:response regulator RpfG family c-di-GMP phosphodiesterase
LDRILIFDNGPASLHGMGALLRHNHYAVLETSTESQAIEVGKTCESLALLVTNVELGRCSSTEVALKLVAIYPDLPLLLLSATPMLWWMSHDASNFKLFPPTGIDFLEKPFSASELILKVRTLIGLSAKPRIEQGSQTKRAA